MPDIISVGVYRMGLPDLGDDDKAWKFHRLRGRVLHDTFDGADAWQVVAWGNTNDEVQTHEWVELQLILGQPAVHVAVASALATVGGIAAKAALAAGAAEAVKLLFAQLWPKQKEQQIAAFSVTLPDKTVIFCEPGEPHSELRFSFNGNEYQISMNAEPGDIPKELPQL
jgi:hypothetical protein